MVLSDWIKAFTRVSYRGLGKGVLTRAQWLKGNCITEKAPPKAGDNSLKTEFWSSLHVLQAAQQGGESFLFSNPYCLYLGEGGALWSWQISGISWDFWDVHFLNFLNKYIYIISHFENFIHTHILNTSISHPLYLLPDPPSMSSFHIHALSHVFLAKELP